MNSFIFAHADLDLPMIEFMTRCGEVMSVAEYNKMTKKVNEWLYQDPDMPDYGERIDFEDFMEDNDITKDQLIRYFIEFKKIYYKALNKYTLRDVLTEYFPKYTNNNLYDMYDNEPIWELALGFIENEPKFIKMSS
jgi:hypothetical protein